MRHLIIIGLLVLAVVLVGCTPGFFEVKYNCSSTKNLSLSFETCNPKSVWDVWTIGKCESMGETRSEISYQSACFGK